MFTLINNICKYEAPLSTITVQLPLCKELLYDELEAGLDLLGASAFIPNKIVTVFDQLVLKRITDLLSILYARDSEAAGIAADALIVRLEKLGSDCESFPEEEIKQIKEAVS